MIDLAKYDPLEDKYPTGVISKDNTVKFKIDVNENCTPNEVYLMIKEDKDSDYEYILMNKNGLSFEVSKHFYNKGHYWYSFKLNYNDFEKYISKDSNYYGEILNYKGEDFLQLVTSEEYENNNSLQGGIIYQILPDRFCRVGDVKIREPLYLRDDWGGGIKKNTTNPVKINEEVFGGNIKGIISKLDYLNNLGVTAIYLNPIFQANSHHKYDTVNYEIIDDMLGTEEDFKQLIIEAKNRNIKIIIDGVFNHTGSDSIYFNKKNKYKEIGAYNSKDSKYYNWFTFKNYPEDYECWWGIITLPSIKKNCLDFQNYIAGDGGVIEKYLKMGISGIRLDVVDELSDSFIKKISDKIKWFGKDNVIIGEVWEDASMKISYSERKKYFVDNEINSVMNYPIKNALIDYIKTKEPKQLLSVMRMLINNYPKKVLDNLMNIVGTHDTYRIATEIKLITQGNQIETFKLLKIIYAILFTIPGVPSIYYGDEYAMENNDETSRGCFDWQNYDNKFYKWIKKLTTIRKYDVLKNGKFNILFSENGKFIFERYNKTQHIVIIVNLKNTPLIIELNGKFKSFFSNETVKEYVSRENSVEILIETIN